MTPIGVPFKDSGALRGSIKHAPDSELIIGGNNTSRSLSKLPLLIHIEHKNGSYIFDVSEVRIGNGKIKVRKEHALQLANWIITTTAKTSKRKGHESSKARAQIQKTYVQE